MTTSGDNCSDTDSEPRAGESSDLSLAGTPGGPLDPGAGIDEALAVAAGAEGVVMLIGGPDVGKTTFCALAARAAMAAGRRVAIVDADPGQSEIGPPTTLGLAVPEGPFTRLAELKPRGLAFVGSTSPRGDLLDGVIGAAALVRRARSLGAGTIFVDMPGLVSGDFGRRFTHATAEALRPAVYVLIERRQELGLLCRGLPPARIVRSGALAGARPKSGTVRRLRRASRFAAYFRDAVSWEYPVDRGILRGGGLFLGRPLLREAMDRLQQNLATELVHVERADSGIRVVTNLWAPAADRAALARHFGRLSLAYTDATRLPGLIAGLLDHAGDTAALGIVERVDFVRRSVVLASPWIDPDALTGLVWGSARVQRDGTELDPLRHGEI